MNNNAQRIITKDAVYSFILSAIKWFIDLCWGDVVLSFLKENMAAWVGNLYELNLNNQALSGLIVLILWFSLFLLFDLWLSRRKDVPEDEGDGDSLVEIKVSIQAQRSEEEANLIVETSSDLNNCFARIVRIKKLYGEDVATSNKNLKWESALSENGEILLRKGNPETLNFAWAKEYDSVWNEDSNYGFSYVIPQVKPILGEGDYSVAVKVEGTSNGEIIKQEKIFSVRFGKKSFDLGRRTVNERFVKIGEV
jgi:membrane protein implicated in regulation of membrane protease activity